MGWRDDWEAIRSGAPADALARLEGDFCADKSNASSALDLVAANMWLGRYAEAVRICDDAASARPQGTSISCFPLQRGAAEWSLGRFDEAVKSWHSTADASFADTAGANVQYLLLLAADGLRQGQIPSAVREAMQAKRSDARIHHSWPGPILLYLLGIYGASLVASNIHPYLDRWQFGFYQALKSYGVRKDVADLLSVAALPPQAVAEPDIEVFLNFVRLPEIYIAREMARTLRGTPK